MSKLEELIAELCPDGVEYKKIGELATILRGASPRPIKNFITSDEDGVNWIKIGDMAIGNKYVTHASEKITAKGAEKSRKVKKGDFILSNSMSFGRPYILAIDGCIHDGWLAISDFNDTFVTDFLYYLLNSTDVQQEMAKRASFGGAVQNLNADIVKSLMLPVPPLSVQREIVRILDIFTEHTTELTLELTAERTARNVQYEYCKDFVFTKFITEHTEYAPLSKVTDVRDGTHDSPKPSNNGKYLLTSKNVKNGTINYDNAYLISEKEFDAINQRSKVDLWDLLFTMIGTVGEVGMIGDEPDFAIKNVGLIKTGDELLSRFLKYYLTTSTVKKYVENNRSKGSQMFLALGKLRNLPIPILERKSMQEIVDLLSHFDDICTDIFSCIPAEIEARQKQYEYYRNKLLSFKNIGDAV
jgi:type I restriction enzyme S subunit